MPKSTAQLAAFRARLRIGLSRAVTPEMPLFRDIRRQLMLKDYRESQPEMDIEEVRSKNEAKIQTISSGQSQQVQRILEYHQAQLNFLTNKIMEKRVETKKGMSKYS